MSYELKVFKIKLLLFDFVNTVDTVGTKIIIAITTTEESFCRSFSFSTFVTTIAIAGSVRIVCRVFQFMVLITLFVRFCLLNLICNVVAIPVCFYINGNIRFFLAFLITVGTKIIVALIAAEESFCRVFIDSTSVATIEIAGSVRIICRVFQIMIFLTFSLLSFFSLFMRIKDDIYITVLISQLICLCTL